MKLLLKNQDLVIAILTVFGLIAHVFLRITQSYEKSLIPLLVAYLVCGTPLIIRLIIKVIKREFGSDHLAGISIVTAFILNEYVAGTLVILMLSGGEAIERFAIKRASSALNALSKRMPNIAHKKSANGFVDVAINEIKISDLIVIFPHESAPVDGEVVEGNSVMDESYLTGEPFKIAKTPGSSVISGAINGNQALTIRATKTSKDSRYAKIIDVMRKAEQEKPNIRRLGDYLGAWYTPVALIIAAIAWIVSADPLRFLAVLVIATPCPLLIAIPVAIIGAISLCAQRGIIVRDPGILEQVNLCETIILDKTGTLTYGVPEVTSVEVLTDINTDELVQLTASIEQYSKHPLSQSILTYAAKNKVILLPVSEVSERPGEGLTGIINGRKVFISNRKKVLQIDELKNINFPELKSGMECVVVIDNRHVGIFHFHDEPRHDSRTFIEHLGPKHRIKKVMIVSGDRASEVNHLAQKVGITEVHASQSPEQKVEHVKRESKSAKTIFIGDGINDAPALMSATVGLAFGQNSDVTSESAGAVILDSSLQRVDELFHISNRMRAILLQSALGGIGLSIIGMFLAAFGLISPVQGAIGQELIDLLAVLNALRVGFVPSELTDYHNNTV